MYRTFAAIFFAASLVFSPAHAGNYPERPIRIINPFPPGTNTDTVARLLAQKLQQNMGQPAVVENKTGAGGAIGATFVARAPADGYTLLLTSSSTHLVAPVLRREVPYDANKDFIPIMTVTVSPHVVVATSSLPVKDFKEFVSYVKANPGTTFASSGNGTGYHLAGELFAHGVGASMLHIPYRGAAPAMNDLLGGQVQSMFDSPGSVAPNVKTGKIRALAIMGPQRWPNLPDVPTTVELGYPQLQFSTWLGLFAPAGTPPEVIAKITDVLTMELSKPGMREQFQQMGSQLNMIVGKDFAQFMLDGQAALRKLVKEANLPMLD